MTAVSLTDPVPGTLADANVIANNNASLRAVVNGGIDNNNFGAGKIFDLTKLMQGGAADRQALVWDNAGGNWIAELVKPSKLAQEAAAKGQSLLWDSVNSKWAPADVTRMYARLGAIVDVVSSAAETTLFSQVITGGDLGTNKRVNFNGSGDYLHNNVAADTITVRYKFGGTTFATLTSNLGNALSATRQAIFWQFQLLMQQATGTEDLFCQVFGNDVTGAFNVNLSTLVANGAIDTTVNQTFAVTAQWSASSANNSFRMREAILSIA